MAGPLFRNSLNAGGAFPTNSEDNTPAIAKSLQQRQQQQTQQQSLVFEGNRQFDKWLTTTEGKAALAKRRNAIAASYGNPSGTLAKSTYEERAKEDLRAVYVSNFGVAAMNMGKTGPIKKKTSPSASSASSSVSSTTSKPTKFENTTTPQQERQPINDKARTFDNSPSNKNVATPSRSFTISNFRSEIESGSVLPSHSYLTTFSPFRPSDTTVALNQMLAAYRDPLTMRCENVVLPTIQLLEEENIRRYGYGPVEKIPYGVQFGDITLTWIVDRYSELPDFFHHWMNSIVTYEAKGALMKSNISNRPGLQNRGAYEVGFKDDYTCPVLTVNVYNQQLIAVADYIMYDVFPMNIQSANLSWADENQYQKLTVTFAFTDMETRAPVKGYREKIDAFETGKLNPYEEKQQLTNKGRDVARDGVVSESDPRTTTFVSSPFSGVTQSPAPTSPDNPVPAGPGVVKKNIFGQTVSTT